MRNLFNKVLAYTIYTLNMIFVVSIQCIAGLVGERMDDEDIKSLYWRNLLEKCGYELVEEL